MIQQVLILTWIVSAAVGVAFGALALYEGYRDYLASKRGSVLDASAGSLLILIALGILRSGVVLVVIQGGYLLVGLIALYAPGHHPEATTAVLMLGTALLTTASAANYRDRRRILRSLRE